MFSVLKPSFPINPEKTGRRRGGVDILAGVTASLEIDGTPSPVGVAIEIEVDAFNFCSVASAGVFGVLITVSERKIPFTEIIGEAAGKEPSPMSDVGVAVGVVMCTLEKLLTPCDQQAGRGDAGGVEKSFEENFVDTS